MRFGATLTCVLGLLLGFEVGRAQDSPPSEYQVKAAFIFNFAKFIEWPSHAFADMNAPLCVGVLGDNPFGKDLTGFLRDKTINNRPVVVKEVRSIAEAKACQVLFVSPSESKRAPEILRELSASNVLTISETERFITDGGMINFFREGTRIRFQINDQAAKNSGLKIASKLLELGRKPAT